MRAVLLAALVAMSCTSRTAARCDRICAREDECTEEQKGKPGIPDPPDFDRAECIEACLQLERDERGREIISRYAECVLKAGGCPAVMACE
jgi:hypothetical protein